MSIYGSSRPIDEPLRPGEYICPRCGLKKQYNTRLPPPDLCTECKTCMSKEEKALWARRTSP